MVYIVLKSLYQKRDVLKSVEEPIDELNSLIQVRRDVLSWTRLSLSKGRDKRSRDAYSPIDFFKQ